MKPGFNGPYPWQQVATWVLEPVVVILFYLTIAGFTQGTELAVSASIYTILVVVNVVCWFLCEYLDPSVKTGEMAMLKFDFERFVNFCDGHFGCCLRFE